MWFVKLDCVEYRKSTEEMECEAGMASHIYIDKSCKERGDTCLDLTVHGDFANEQPLTCTVDNSITSRVTRRS